MFITNANLLKKHNQVVEAGI